MKIYWTVMLCAGMALADQNLLVNSAFREGKGKQPDGWTLQGNGEWSQDDGVLAISGDGKASWRWLSADFPVKPGECYWFSFDLRTSGAGGGCVVAGADSVNNDEGFSEDKWAHREFAFCTPDGKETERIHLGQWTMNGTAFFRNPELYRTTPIHSSAGGLPLGVGEIIEGNDYSFKTQLGKVSKNYSRALMGYTANLNSDRWCISANKEVVYKFQLPGRKFLSAKTKFSCGYYAGGKLLAEFSKDAKEWTALGEIDKTGSFTFEIPTNACPAEVLFVRMHGAPAGCDLQIYELALDAKIDGEPLARSVGRTKFLRNESEDAKLRVRVDDLGATIPGEKNEVSMHVDNNTGAATNLMGLVVFSKPDVASVTNQMPIELPGAGAFDIRIPYEMPGVGTWKMTVELGVSNRFSTAVSVSPFYDDSYGELLPVARPEFNLWRASSGWKIPRHRNLPKTITKQLTLRMARNEAEALQLVVTPNRTLQNLKVRVGDLMGVGAKIPASQITVLAVGYVPIQRTTDNLGVVAEWPDPLLPQTDAGIVAKAGENQPFWIRVKAPKGTPAGIYRGRVSITAAGGISASTVLNVQVFDFDLPDQMTCETSFGFGIGRAFSYQKAKTPEEKKQIAESYLTHLSDHHISPYNPTPLVNWSVSWQKDGKPWKGKEDEKDAKEKLNTDACVPIFDWKAWDEAMEAAFARWHFNSFVIHVAGLGWGDWSGQGPQAKFLGYLDDEPEYEALWSKYVKQIEAHLKEKGWLEKAYVYWYDEPQRKVYDYVANGLKKLKKHAPGLRRFMTVQVEPEFLGLVNLWCPLTPSLERADTPKCREAGDQFWWYVCCGPHAPYVTEFIDHPGTEMRLWLWQTWQHQVTGILIWETLWWTSPQAYPDGAHPQNPYLDPMSWVADGRLAPGTKSPWGNGDGRFLYPPVAAADGAQERTVLDEPVDSYRLELLRDGVEDYEYFVMLKKLLAEKKSKLAPRDAQNLEDLLVVPESVSKNMTNFTTDPAPMESHREKLAHAIERLSKL